MIFRRSSKGEITVDGHKQVEQLLRHLGMIAQQTDEGIAMVDLKGTIHFVNMAWAKMHGYETSNELLGKQISVFYTKEQIKSDVVPLIEKARREGWSVGVVEHARRDGTTFPTQMKTTVLKDEGGTPSGLMVIITDITECKRLEESSGETTTEGKELKEQIEQLQHEITEHEQAEEHLRQEAGELTAANEQLKRQITEREQAKKELMEQLDALTEAIEEIHYEMTKRSRGQEIVEARTDDAEESKEPVASFDVEKLKTIAELAKRLR